jgi:hypothetical protein
MTIRKVQIERLSVTYFSESIVVSIKKSVR